MNGRGNQLSQNLLAQLVFLAKPLWNFASVPACPPEWNILLLPPILPRLKWPLFMPCLDEFESGKRCTPCYPRSVLCWPHFLTCWALFPPLSASLKVLLRAALKPSNVFGHHRACLQQKVGIENGLWKGSRLHGYGGLCCLPGQLSILWFLS